MKPQPILNRKAIRALIIVGTFVAAVIWWFFIQNPPPVHAATPLTNNVSVRFFQPVTCVRVGERVRYLIKIANEGPDETNAQIMVEGINSQPWGFQLTKGTSHLSGRGPYYLYWLLNLKPGQTITKQVAVIPHLSTAQKGPQPFWLGIRSGIQITATQPGLCTSK